MEFTNEGIVQTSVESSLEDFEIKRKLFIQTFYQTSTVDYKNFSIVSIFSI